MENQISSRGQFVLRPRKEDEANPIIFPVAEVDDGIQTLLDYLVEIAIQEVVEEARVACVEVR